MIADKENECFRTFELTCLAKQVLQILPAYIERELEHRLSTDELLDYIPGGKR